MQRKIQKANVGSKQCNMYILGITIRWLLRFIILLFGFLFSFFGWRWGWFFRIRAVGRGRGVRTTWRTWRAWGVWGRVTITWISTIYKYDIYENKYLLLKIVSLKFIFNIYICNYLLFEALILSTSFLFSAFSSKLDEFVLLAFPWIVSLILRFRVVVLESLCTYFLSPLHSYVQWPSSKHFWHLCVLVSSTVLKEKSPIGKCVKCL